jgi:hypothetical protein
MRVSPWVGCHGIAEVLSSVSPFKKGWVSLAYTLSKNYNMSLIALFRDDVQFDTPAVSLVSSSVVHFATLVTKAGRSEWQGVTVHQVSMCNSFRILKRKNKLCPDQFGKVTYPKLKLPLTNQTALVLTWPANGRWKFQIFRSLGAKSWDVLMRHLDAIGALCRKCSLTEVRCESPESLVPTAVRIQLTKVRHLNYL